MATVLVPPRRPRTAGTLLRGLLALLALAAVVGLLLLGSADGQRQAHGGMGASRHDECEQQLVDILNNPNSTNPDADRLMQDALALHKEFLATIGSPQAEGHIGEIPLQMQVYARLAGIPCVRIVCEIGFNLGHSAAFWLSSNRSLNLMSFDLGKFDQMWKAAAFFSDKAPGRLVMRFGNSMRSVPGAARLLNRACDLLIVDGGHDYDVAAADVANFAPLANPRFNIFVIDDVGCDSLFCNGPNQALKEAQESGKVSVMKTFGIPSDTGHGVGRGFAVGHYLTAPQQPWGEGV